MDKYECNWCDNSCTIEREEADNEEEIIFCPFCGEQYIPAEDMYDDEPLLDDDGEFKY